MIGRRPARRRALVALLLLACLLGAGLVWLQRAHPTLMVRRLTTEAGVVLPGQDPADAATPVGASTAPPPESRFAVIALRPLFVSGRRPPDRPGALAGATTGDGPPALLVTGIVMAGDDSVAILEPEARAPGAEPALVVRVDDTVSGWTVEAIEAGQVTLVRDGVRHNMALIEEDDRRRAPRRRVTTPNQLRRNQPQPPTPTQRQPQQRLPQPPTQPAPLKLTR